ncbi:MAG: hypothetical protein HC777_03345 [Hyphomonadaceae bacterium]|nr:hypothetical protein [Hyphomonadaceae bacterium]
MFQAFDHFHADRAHLGFERDEQNLIIERPSANRIVFINRFAAGSWIRMADPLCMARNCLGEMLIAHTPAKFDAWAQKLFVEGFHEPSA